MSVMKWDPLKDLFYMEKNINKLIAASFKETDNNWSPLVDIIENNDSIILITELAGVYEKDIEVTLSDGVLTIKGIKYSPMDEYDNDENCYKLERTYGKFTRSFAIPSNIDTEAIKASLKDGLLKIVLNKTNKNNKKNIKIYSNDK